MTAFWESQLESISMQSVTYQSFISGVEQNLVRLIDHVKGVSFHGLPQDKVKKTFRRKRKAKRQLKG
jgi:DNA topoisomerase-3